MKNLRGLPVFLPKEGCPDHHQHAWGIGMAANKICLFILVLTLLFWGCSGSRLMMPTPNVYLNQKLESFQGLAKDLQGTEVRLFYITDRTPEKDDAGNFRYGYGRSSSLAFGTAVVDLGVEISWEALLEASRTRKRIKPVKLHLMDVTEMIRSPNTPLPYTLMDGRIVEDPKLLAKLKETAQAFREVLVEQLSLTPRKEVFIYIHGYNNTFEDAAFAMAELWHFLGRIGVPIIYTWPAGYPGLFGYTYDRESSEFTIYHLRQVLGFIASFPEVEKIHVIAHSRGTDVATAALRELTLGARQAGIDPIEKYKIHNFVLAAPDIDMQVAEQRVAGDKLRLSVKRFTVYTSPADKAIGAASRLFQSPRGRAGTFGLKDVTKDLRRALEFNTSNFAVVNFSGISNDPEVGSDFYGHSYFRNAPSVSSDLVLMLRDDLDPGSPGRPLEHVDLNFWRIPAGYPRGMSNAQKD